ncbi:MAG: MFS transporter, partial [Alphaproteobacteria bacterium]
AFAVPGVVAIVTGVAFLMLIRTTVSAGERPAPRAARPASPALVRRVFLFVALASLFGGIVFSVMTVALPKMLAEGLGDGGGGALTAGTLAAGIFAIAAFAQIATGRAVDRMAPRALMLGLAGGQLVLFALLAQAFGWPLLLLGFLVMPLVFGEIPVHDAMVAHYGAAQWRGRIYALKYVLSLGVSGAAVPLVVWLHAPGTAGGNGFVWLYITLAIAAAMVAAASLLLPGRKEAASLAAAEAR